MAVVLLKSTSITNLDTTPPIKNPFYKAEAPLREAIDTFSITSGDSAASIYRVVRVHSSWRISSVLVDAPDIGTTTTADIGLYDTAANGAAVVDVDFFASAIVLNAGAIANSDVTHEAGTTPPISAYGTRLWEQLSLTSDPSKWYDVALTLVGAADGTGVGAVRVRYAGNVN